MVKCSYCGNMHDDSEIDEENFTCHQCGMPIGYAGENDENDEEEVNDFFNEEEDSFDDPDALTDEDLTELLSGELQGIDDIDDDEFEDDDFDDEEDEEDY